MAQKPVLGKGLASLFPGFPPPHAPMAPSAETAQGAGAVRAPEPPIMPAPPTAPTAAVAPATGASTERGMLISMAGVEDIKVNPYQPRREFDEKELEDLAGSIRSSGIIQPLVIRKTASGELQLIAGERRLRAAKMAGLKQVPVVVRRSATDREALELALIENIQRQNLGCIDEALAYNQLLVDFSLTQEEVATRVGKERATVANYLRLLKLPQEIIDDLRAERLSFGHGKALLGLENVEDRMRARAKILERRMSVRDAEALVDQIKNPPQEENAAEPSQPSDPLSRRKSALELELTRKWHARVELRGSDKKGKIVFHYASRQELDRLVEALHN